MYSLIAAFTPLAVSDTCYKFKCRGIKNICPATCIGYIYFAVGGCNAIGLTGKCFGCAVAYPVSDTSTMGYLPVLFLEDFYTIVSGSIIDYVNAILIGGDILRLEGCFCSFGYVRPF